MKKLLSLILAGAMLFSFAACEKDKDEKEKSDEKNNNEIVEDGGSYSDEYVETQIGSYITFGSYEQDNDTSNGKEPIEWLILDEKDGKALVVSKYALDCQRYDASHHNDEITWENCTLRAWLNDEFINEAFSSSEMSKISTSTVTADANPGYDTDPGVDTEDKIFLLSLDEANTYFKSNESRMCELTEYAIAQGADTKEKGEYVGLCWWLLRTPGRNYRYVAHVLVDGSPYEFGNGVGSAGYAVRPAMWIEL